MENQESRKGVHLHRELELLKNKILQLGGDVEKSLGRSITAFKDLDEKLAKKVIEYEKEIDSLEVAIEEECLKIMALYQPVASDLRFVVAVFKINNDLERIADNAANLAKRVIHLGKSNQHDIPESLVTIMELSLNMLKKSLDAFVDMDTNLAREVIESDDTIDSLHRNMFEIVQQNIIKNRSSVVSQINILSISRQTERISDLVTNIAEDVIYLVDGDIVRHGFKE